MPRIFVLYLSCSFLVVSSSAADDEQPPDGLIVQYNLRYRDGESKAWVLDLAMPKDQPDKPRPAIVVIHGGGWLNGDKSSFSTLKNRQPGNILDFAKLGFVAVTINYRLSGEATFPAAVQDCQCAVRWLRANAEEYHIDPDRIGAWGNSAGGHLALMLGMLGKDSGIALDGPHQEFSSSVQAAASDSGPIDLKHQHEHDQVRYAIQPFLGGPPEGDRLAAYKLASPSSHVSKQVCPMLLIYGVEDEQVGVETSDAFVNALREAGLKDVTYHRLAAVGHCPHSIKRVPWLAPVVDDFFKRTLHP
jgi:acetyl esterase/lipase